MRNEVLLLLIPYRQTDAVAISCFAAESSDRRTNRRTLCEIYLHGHVGFSGVKLVGWRSINGRSVSATNLPDMRL